MNNKITSSQRPVPRAFQLKGVQFHRVPVATNEPERTQNAANSQHRPPDEQSQFIYDLMNLNNKQMQRPLNLKKSNVQKMPSFSKAQIQNQGL